MYLLHAINNDRQTRLLNVFGQIALILGDNNKLCDKLTPVTSQPPGTVATERGRYDRSIHVDHLYSKRLFFRGLTNWFSQRCLSKQVSLKN